MIYVWAGIVIVVLFLITRIVRWWNLPATIEARNHRIEARRKARESRIEWRRRRWLRGAPTTDEHQQGEPRS